MIGRMMMLDGAAFHDYLQSPKVDKISRLLLIAVGILYGIISILTNWTYVSGFDSQVLKFFVVPGIFIIFGLLTALITRLGLSLLLWASSKGFGGKGMLGQVNKAASVSLVPGILSVPFLAGSFNIAVIALLGAGLIWMYLVSVQIVKATQGFDAKKAYLASLLSFVFLASIYYIIVPS
ncbi:hypothetical protein JMA_05260 [Jeotgalibacillus malaysiensis]|uniref:Uncharacterized protein n=1 Tax=Jeotgalibacillus malaysiensis TaxID=1508404 RepID=A0A0B5AMU6_9BACL|nr:YIP1 family protein [Jeotgalibacillus malaysiensis]AJD89843.1 hypothetical protein JMA_05260 [Jeotgalibacillus malaysiensis]